jgi:opacity protein-like surface antigen
VLWAGAALTFWLPSVSLAEWYVGGQFGVNMPDTFSNVHLTNPTFAGGVVDARVSDLDRQSSGVLGAKVGYFSEDRDWLGVEADFFTSQILIKQQTVVGGVPGRTFSETLPGQSAHLSTLAFNLIVREPALSQKFNPYGGIGPAIFVTSGNDFNVTVGINLVAGARYFVRDNLAFFGEFKYDRANVDFNGISGTYAAQIFVVGISYHFKKPKLAEKK